MQRFHSAQDQRIISSRTRTAAQMGTAYKSYRKVSPHDCGSAGCTLCAREGRPRSRRAHGLTLLNLTLEV